MFLNENLGHLTLIVEKQHLKYISVGSISLHNLGTFVTFAEPYLIILLSERLERIYPCFTPFTCADLHTVCKLHVYIYVFWACERNCIYVKVNLHMCKYKPPCKYTPAQTRCIFAFAFAYMYFIHICIFWSCERAANIHTYANLSFPLISSKIDSNNKNTLC